ncbi:MAG: TiaS agmantine-binding domain-containing protein [Thermoplasmatota archaeon]
MLLAFDDTDGPGGGCTTHALFHALLALPDLAPLALPRLVRLNPNVPWKTRGNAAVAVPLGHPEGAQTRIGELQGREILAFPEGRPAEPTPERLEAVWNALDNVAQGDANPAVALLPRPLPLPWAYWAAVRTVVDPPQARADLEASGALLQTRGDDRALVGCAAAAAWPGPPSSYELIAYRQPPQWGKPRAVEPGPLQGLDRAGITFHTTDPEEGRLACVPATPCPVLLGLRGRDPEKLRDWGVRALGAAAREPIDGWLLWATNQASGDHVTPVEALAEAPELGTVHLAATVAGMPRTRSGGHVLVDLEDPVGRAFQAAAFEPTKKFRDVVRALRPGDAVEVVGALRDATVHLEKLRVVSLAESKVKVANPTCACGDRMKSAGADAGWRCPTCGASTSEALVEVEERGVSVGWYEVPVMARRHLHRMAAIV